MTILVLLVFLGGALTILSPCILPVLPFVFARSEQKFLSSGVPMLLGEFIAHVDRCVHVDEPCVVLGWQLAANGRKHEVGTALFDEEGELCARARATWIEPRKAAGEAPMSPR